MCEYVIERGRESGPKRARGTLTPLPPGFSEKHCGPWRVRGRDVFQGTLSCTMKLKCGGQESTF